MTVLDLESPEGLFQAFMRVSGSVANEDVIIWHELIRYGLIGTDMKPLHTTHGVMVVKHTNHGDGSFTCERREIAFHRDLETGDVLDTFDNPFTGETNTVKHLRSGPVVTGHTAHSLTQGGQELPLKHQIGPALVHNGQVYINHDLSANFPGPDGRVMVFYDYVKYQCALSDLEDPSIANVPATFAIQDYIGFRPWMNMGDQVGLLPGRGLGIKIATLDDIPGDLLDLIRERDPAFLDDPENWQGDSLI